MDKINDNKARKPENESRQKAITKKYDKGYKRIFSRKRNFLHFLKKYIKNDKSGWIDSLNEDDLIPIDTELIDNEFKKRESDIIYRMKLKGRDVIFYTLLELQSSVDFTMPFRLLRYMTLILNFIFENTPKNEREAKDYRLPAVIPIIVYNGADNWTAARTWHNH